MNTGCPYASWGWHHLPLAPCRHQLASRWQVKHVKGQTYMQLIRRMQQKRAKSSRVLHTASYRAATVSSRTLTQQPVEQLQQLQQPVEQLQQLQQDDVLTEEPAGHTSTASIARQVSSRQALHTGSLHSKAKNTARDSRQVPRSAAQLTQAIKACSTWQQVQEVYNLYGTRFDFMHIAACITHLAQLSSSSGAPTQPPVSKPDSSTTNSKRSTAGSSTGDLPTNSENMAAGSNTGGLTTSSEHMTAGGSGMQASIVPQPLLCPLPCCTLLQQLLTQLEPVASKLRGRETANIAWALAKLGCHPDHMLTQQCMARCWDRVSQMNAQELTNTLYASALLGLTPAHPQHMRAVIAALPNVLSQCSSHAISNMVWALGRLRQHQVWLPAMVVRKLLAASYAHMYAMTPQGLVMLAYGLLQLGVAMPNAWRKRLMDATWRLLPHSQPSNTSALPQDSTSVAVMMQDDASQLQPQLKLQHSHSNSSSDVAASGWTAAGLVHLMWAVIRSHSDLGTLRSGPPRSWLAACLKQIQQEVHSLPAQETAQLLWLLAKLRVRPPVSFLERLLVCLSSDVQAVGAEGLAGLAWSLARLDARPSKQLAELLLRTTYQRRNELPIRSAITFLISLPSLGLRPTSKFMHSLLASWQGRLGTHGTWLDLLQLSAGLPELPHKPPEWLLGELLQLLQRHGKRLNVWRLHKTLQGLKQLGASQETLQPWLDRWAALQAHERAADAADANQSGSFTHAADAADGNDVSRKGSAADGDNASQSGPVETSDSVT